MRQSVRQIDERMTESSTVSYELPVWVAIPILASFPGLRRRGEKGLGPGNEAIPIYTPRYGTIRAN